MNEITCLYYICHVENLASIVEQGIFSGSQIQKRGIPHREISNSSVLSKRHSKDKNPGGRPLKEFVNLYFCAHNAMLCVLCLCPDKKIGAENLVVLRISADFLHQSDCYISDCNAASSYAQFFPASEYKKHINFKVLNYPYWLNDEVMRKMMAEVLVPDHVGPEKIIALHVSNKDTQSRVEKTITHLPVIYDFGMFYFGR